MEKESSTQPCRKCGASNPASDEYCAHCGAMQKVSTRAMAAQPRAVVPVMKRVEVKWVLLGIPVMLGMGTVAVVTGVLLGVFVLKIAGSGGLSGLKAMTSHFLLTLGFLVSLFTALGGAMMSRMSGAGRVPEAVIASFVASLFMGVAARTISADLLLATLVLSVPGAVFAGVGARFGKGKGAP